MFDKRLSFVVFSRHGLLSFFVRLGPLFFLGCPNNPSPFPTQDAGPVGISSHCKSEAERCNQQDDNCNGLIDENCPCQTTGRACYTALRKTLGKGSCLTGVQRCTAGKWDNICHGETTPSTELCNGLDDDCDGNVDNPKQHQTGTLKRPCRTPCGKGTETCQKGKWVLCTAPGHPKEICDNLKDDNCDGKIDENCFCRLQTTRTCYTGPLKTKGVGRCQTGIQRCTEPTWPQKCPGEILPKPESCNKKDDNCDGNIDEGCDCKESNTRSCGQDTGECERGIQQCKKGKWSLTCQGATAPSKERCNGKDDNCDGIVDGLLKQPCKTACGKGTETCENGHWQGCTAPPSRFERCNNQDDNCDGNIDEDLRQTCQTLCGSGLETCAKGLWKGCDAPTPKKEVCNNKDDDCDGKIDNGLGWVSCGRGLCRHRVSPCVRGQIQRCQPLPPATTEYCGNLIDDDCDGSIDLSCSRCLPASLSSLKNKAHTTAITKVIFSPNGKSIATGSRSGKIKLWNQNLVLQKTIQGHTQAITALLFSPDNKQFVSSSFGYDVHLWESATGIRTKTLKGHTGAINALAFNPNGTVLASGSSDKSIRVWPLAGSVAPVVLLGHLSSVRSIVYHPQDRLIASGSNLFIKWWDLSTKRITKTLSGHTAAIIQLAFTPDGRFLASASNDGTIKIWGYPSGILVRTLKAHTGPIIGMSMGPTGRLIASASQDHTVKLWELQSGRVLKSYSLHKDWVNDVSIDPTGTQLASVSDDQSLHIWSCLSTSCPPGSNRTICAGLCIDTQSNSQHCGKCNQKCPVQGQQCTQGKCQCPTGFLLCQNECIDQKTNWKHCGGCNKQCAQGVQKCQGGICKIGCPNQQKLCGNQCVDVLTSKQHCGSCQQVCQGQCCNGTCFPFTHSLHCGRCGNRCPIGGFCQQQCRCPLNQTACNGSCIDTQTNEEHCGLCSNRCPPTPQTGKGICLNGQCQ